MSSHFNEQNNTADTVTLESCTGSRLIVGLANSGESYVLDEQHDLDLRLKNSHATLTLEFGYADGWPASASATVRLGSGPDQDVPCSFSDLPTGSQLHITVTTDGPNAKRLTTWDPKIKVVAPTRTDGKD